MRSIAGLVAVAVVCVAVVLAAAGGGEWHLEDRGFTLQPSLPEPPPIEPIEVEEPELPGLPGRSGLDLSWFRAVWIALVVLVALLVSWWLWAWLSQRPWAVRPVTGAATAGAAAVADEPALPVLQRGVAEARGHLDRVADPTDAVIAAWLALEEAAEASGVRRGAAQTPTEFTVAVLERTAADPEATRELLGLYHRARFSGRPVAADDVTAASACLGRLAAGWATRSTPEGPVAVSEDRLSGGSGPVMPLEGPVAVSEDRLSGGSGPVMPLEGPVAVSEDRK